MQRTLAIFLVALVVLLMAFLSCRPIISTPPSPQETIQSTGTPKQETPQKELSESELSEADQSIMDWQVWKLAVDIAGDDLTLDEFKWMCMWGFFGFGVCILLATGAAYAIHAPNITDGRGVGWLNKLLSKVLIGIALFFMSFPLIRFVVSGGN